MPWHNYLALAFIAIFIFLILNNYQATVQVMTALGGQATALTGALQGRGVSNNGINLSAPSTTGVANIGTGGLLA